MEKPPSPYRGTQAADEGRGRGPAPPVPDPWIAGEYRDGSRRQAAPSTMQAGGWRSETTVARYTARESAARGAVARFYEQETEQ